MASSIQFQGDLEDLKAKLGYFSQEPKDGRRCKTVKNPFFLLGVFVAATLSSWFLYTAIPRPQHQDPQDVFTAPSKNTSRAAAAGGQVSWENITPSENLYWYPCNGNFYCARLTVPMDYNRPLNQSESNPKVYIGLMMLPGTHSGSQNYSTSPVIFNFGGPGVSGVAYFQDLATALQTVTGTGQDIVTFDPRGVGTTLPPADCFSGTSSTSTNDSSSYFEEDNAFGSYKRTLWRGAGGDDGNIHSSADALQKVNVRSTTLATLCQQKDAAKGSNSIFRYMHSSVVARDMISIVDAWTEYTSRQNGGPRASNRKDERDTTVASAALAQGQLVYWGLSVGVNGVLDADKYTNPIWSDTLGSMEHVISTFPKYCLQAGSQCALYRSGDSETNIATRFQSVMDNIKANPVPLITSKTKTPVIINYSEMRNLLFSVSYTPIKSFPPLAVIFNSLLNNNASALELVVTVPDDPTPFSARLPSYKYQPKEEQLGIMCSDKRYPLSTDLAGMESYYTQVLSTSSFADTWVTLMNGCNTWSLIPRPAPFDIWDDKKTSFTPINTANPLLFLSNTYDPVTPLSAAVKMAGRFVNAGLIEQTNGIGHTSLSAVSLCALGKVQAYLQKGATVPPPSGGVGTQCSVDEYPWHPYESASKEKRSKLETRNMEALKEVQRAFGRIPLLGQTGRISLDALSKE